MSKFKVGETVCWRRTKQTAKIYAIGSDGKLFLSPNAKLAWSTFFFERITEPNSIMKDITSMTKIFFSLVNNGTREVPPKEPVKAYRDDAGFDLFCTNSFVVETNDIVKIPTGVVCAIPPGYYGQVNDRSSMGLRGAKCLAGVIDSGFCGEISVIMTNLSKSPLIIKAGDKIAQLIVHSIFTGDTELVKKEDLPVTDRHTSGFGSSGK